MVDHSVSVPLRAHFTGTTLVMHLHGHRFNTTRPVLIGAEFQVLTTQHGVRVQFGPVLLKSLGFAELDHHLYTLHDTVQIHIHRIAEEIRVYHWFIKRISTAQTNLLAKNFDL